MADIAFIVADSGSLLAMSETSFKDRLEADGHTVTVIDDSAAEATDFSPYNMIVVCYACNIASVDGLKTITKPFMFMNGNLEAEYDFGTGSGANSADKFNILDNSHFVTRNQSTGELLIYSTGTGQAFITGFSNDVDDLATEMYEATRMALGVIEKNQTLVDSSLASERRVFFGAYKGSQLNTAGWDLFDESIVWLLYDDDTYIAYGVSNVSSLSGPETAVKAQIEVIANCVLIDDGDMEYNCENSNFEVLVCGGAVGATELDDLKTERTPLMFFSRWCTDEIGIASSSDADSITQIKIVDVDHFITKHESLGDLTVFSSAQNTNEAVGWGNDVVDLAQKTDEDTRAPICICEKGDKLQDGTTASERRVFWGLTVMNNSNANAKRLFQRALVWLLKRRGYIAYVTETGAFVGRNLYWKDRLYSQRFGVCRGIADNDAEAHTYTPYDMIIVGRSCNESFVDGLKAETKPLMFHRHFLETEYGMGTGNDSTDNTIGDIENNTHYINKVFSNGDLTVHGSSQALDAITGTSQDVVGLFTHDGVSARKIIAICESGDTLSDSTIAAERRCFWGLSDSDDPHANLLILFDRAISWCLYFDQKKHIALIVADTTDLDEEKDVPVYDRLRFNLDYVVVLHEDGDAGSDDFSDYDGIVIAGSITPTSSVAALKDDAVGILTLMYYTQDEFELGTDSGSVNGSATQINIVDDSHYITSDFSTGALTVATNSTFGQFSGWSQDVNDLAQIVGQATQSPLLEIDKDETLVDMSSAAERRVFYGVCNFYATRILADGWHIFDRAVQWICYDVDGGVTYEKTFTVDMALRKLGYETQFTLDMAMRETKIKPFDLDLALRETIIKQFSLDIATRETKTEPFSLDLVLKELGKLSQFDLDIALRELKETSFDIDTVLHKIGLEPFDLDIALKGTLEKTFTVDIVLGKVYDDALDLVKEMLEDEWDSGTYPKVRVFYSFDKKRTTVKNMDLLILYRTVNIFDPQELEHDYHDTRDVISCEIRTKKGWTHLKNLYGEVKRIVDANRVDPFLSYDTLKILRFNDFPDFKFWRRVIEIEVNEQSQPITG